MNNFEIRVNRRIFTLWEDASYNRSLDYLCGSFSFSTTDKSPLPYPVKKGDEVEISINGSTVLSGFVEKISIKGSLSGTSVDVSGRDKTADIVDSSVPEGAKNNEGSFSLSSLCSAVISGLGVSVGIVDDSGGIEPFTEKDLQAASSGSNAFDFLNNFARKRQVYLITSPGGDMILYRPGGRFASTVIRNEQNNRLNNVLSWSCENSDEQRYNQYKVKSQDNIGFDKDANSDNEGMQRKGIAFDDDIRNTRYLEIIGEESMKDTEAKDRADEEANLRRARGFSYGAELAGITQDNGELWQIGQLVEIRDYRSGVYGYYLAKDIEIKQGLDGSYTSLTLVEPDAYLVAPTKTKKSKRLAKTTERFSE